MIKNGKNLLKISSFALSAAVALTTYAQPVSTFAAEETESAPTVLYEQNFDQLTSLPSKWTIVKASSTTISIKNGVLNIDAAKTSAIQAVYFNEDVGSDYTVSADFTINDVFNSTRWVGIAVRVQKNDGWFKGSIGTSATAAINNYTKTAISGGAWVEYTKIAMREAPKLGETHRMSMTCFGNNACLYVDGEYMTDVTLPEKYSGGSFGITVSGANVDVDNLTVTLAKEKAPTPDNGIADVVIPSTGIVNPPVVVSDGTATCSTAPAVTIAKVDDNGVIDGLSLRQYKKTLDLSTIPAYHVESRAAANAVAKYLSENDVYDALILADEDSAEFVSSIKETAYNARGIIKFKDIPKDFKAASKIREKVNLANANVALLPAGTSVDVIYHLQMRMITVWTYASSAEEMAEAITSGVNGIVTSDTDGLYKLYSSFTSPTLIRKPNAMAHRGATGLYVQNTLNGMILAYEMGARNAETDLWLTTDDKIVLLHDSQLDALTNGTGAIESYTLEQLKKLIVDVKPDIEEVIPTLEDLMAYFKGTDMVLMFEIKSSNPKIFTVLKELVDKYDFSDNFVIMKGKTDMLRIADEVFPDVAIARGGLSDVINKIPEDERSIAAAIRDMAQNSFQPFPYWYNTNDGTWAYLYKFAARGWLSFASTCSTRHECDARLLNVFGATSVLVDNFQWNADYLYGLSFSGGEFTREQLETLTGELTGLDGTYPEKVKLALLDDGMLTENSEIDAGEHLALAYVDVCLKRENSPDINYRLYSAPARIKVVG